MQLTRAADYGVRVMVHLASLPSNALTSLPALAEAVEVPEQFLSKVLQTLCRSRLIHSQRGASGGFRLAADPEAVSLLQVVEAIEGPIQLNACLGVQGCTRKSWCPAHLVWVEAQRALTDVLQRASIAKLAREAGRMS
ncbi:MAG TPA: Rrf2 family transcriptional regulator [Bryobacteraceae bacterium]|nr:Rrf2 family transcriptional regulator [Bryobacteraceae bacterium]